MYLSNKSSCVFKVVIYYCDGNSDIASCGLNAVNPFSLNDDFKYFDVYFGTNTIPDITIINDICTTPASQNGANPCGSGYYAASVSQQQYNFAANQ